MILQMSIEKAPNAPQRWVELREFIMGSALGDLAPGLIDQVQTHLNELAVKDKDQGQAASKQGMAEGSPALDSLAMPFIEKHLKRRVNGVHVLDTDEGPVDMARNIHAMTTTSMFLGRSMGEVARTLAKKVHHHDHHFVAIMAHPRAHAKTIFEFLKELSGTSTKNPPLARGLRLLLGYEFADQDSVLESVVAFLFASRKSARPEPIPRPTLRWRRVSRSGCSSMRPSSRPRSP